MPLHIETPISYSRTLKNQFSQSVYFKLDALQPPGSFKIRGIGRLCQHYQEQGATQFVSSSGGNAGIAVAYAGKKLGIPVTVFIPTTSHQIYIDALKAYGAEVNVVGDVWDDTHQAALDYSKGQSAAFIHPFEHPIIWSGHSTMIDEVAQTNLIPDAVVVAVGGGGLACGILEGMHKHAWNHVPLVTVETKGADCFAQSLQAKQILTLDKITSKATSLGARRVTEKLFAWSKQHEIIPIVVTDQDAEFGSHAFAKDQRILVELSAGAALSVVYQHHAAIQAYNNILVIVCGGINISFMHIS